MPTTMVDLGPTLLGVVDSSAESTSIVVSVLMALVVIGVMSWLNARSRRRVEALTEEQRRGNVQMQHNAERDQKAYDLHMTLNQLTADKVRLENQYLQLQLRIGQLEVEAREHSEEYHTLMRQKTQLEIQSLKLHIREQTKRLDDFSGYEDD